MNINKFLSEDNWLILNERDYFSVIMTGKKKKKNVWCKIKKLQF